jgi:predicted MFS family arabinose efflux permease
MREASSKWPAWQGSNKFFMSRSIRFFTALWLAVCISMAAAVSLGVTRFAYALLLPPMREDLAWSYTLAGAMNTLNAVGYLAGALLTPWVLRRWGAVRVLIWGALMASILMAATGFLTDTLFLLLQRLFAGAASAAVFVSGGLLAARLGAHLLSQSGLLLGIYYGGTGWGIALSAWVVPASVAQADRVATAHSWMWAWWSLAVMCLLMTALLLLIRAHMHRWLSEDAKPITPITGATQAPPVTVANGLGSLGATFRYWWPWAPGLLGYGLFGVGYIGYMTFVVAVLHEQGASPTEITLFYLLLGLAVVASSRVWAGLLNHYRGGQALAILNVLLSVATLIPVLTSARPMMLLSGVMFGGVFLSVVASTTAMVKHNLPPTLWASGISVFTVVFAVGQIVGPTVVGWIADGPGGLSRGLVFSSAALLLGALVAWRQKPLAPKVLPASPI